MPFARPVEEDVGELRCLGDAECRVQHHWQQRGHWKRDELGHPPAIGYEVMLKTALRGSPFALGQWDYRD